MNLSRPESISGNAMPVLRFAMTKVKFGLFACALTVGCGGGDGSDVGDIDMPQGGAAGSVVVAGMDGTSQGGAGGVTATGGTGGGGRVGGTGGSPAVGGMGGGQPVGGMGGSPPAEDPDAPFSWNGCEERYSKSIAYSVGPDQCLRVTGNRTWRMGSWRDCDNEAGLFVGCGIVTTQTIGLDGKPVRGGQDVYMYTPQYESTVVKVERGTIVDGHCSLKCS